MMHPTPDTLEDHHVAEFIDLAESAHVYFDIINDRLTMRAVNPVWEMWRPFRHLLDEIGSQRIETYLRHRAKPDAQDPSLHD